MILDIFGFWWIFNTKLMICEIWLWKIGYSVMWWFAPSPPSKRVPGWNPGLSLSVCSPHVCVVSLRVPKNMRVRLIGVSKLSLRVSMSEYECAWLCVSFVSVWPCDGLATCPVWWWQAIFCYLCHSKGNWIIKKVSNYINYTDNCMYCKIQKLPQRPSMV